MHISSVRTFIMIDTSSSPLSERRCVAKEPYKIKAWEILDSAVLGEVTSYIKNKHLRLYRIEQMVQIGFSAKSEMHLQNGERNLNLHTFITGDSSVQGRHLLLRVNQHYYYGTQNAIEEFFEKAKVVEMRAQALDPKLNLEKQLQAKTLHSAEFPPLFTYSVNVPDPSPAHLFQTSGIELAGSSHKSDLIDAKFQFLIQVDKKVQGGFKRIRFVIGGEGFQVINAVSERREIKGVMDSAWLTLRPKNLRIDLFDAVPKADTKKNCQFSETIGWTANVSANIEGNGGVPKVGASAGLSYSDTTTVSMQHDELSLERVPERRRQVGWRISISSLYERNGPRVFPNIYNPQKPRESMRHIENGQFVFHEVPDAMKSGLPPNFAAAYWVKSDFDQTVIFTMKAGMRVMWTHPANLRIGNNLVYSDVQITYHIPVDFANMRVGSCIIKKGPLVRDYIP